MSNYYALMDGYQGNVFAVGPFTSIDTARDWEDTEPVVCRGVVEAVSPSEWKNVRPTDSD